MRAKLQHVCWVTVFAAALIGNSRAAEVKIKTEDLPKKVSDSLSARFPELKITSAAKEADSSGKVVYDIELTQKNRKFETDILEDGSVLEVEKEVTSKHWPKEIQSTVEAKYPKGKITEVMEVNKVTGKKEVPIHLELTIQTADHKEAELLTSLDGKTVVKDEQAAENNPSGDEERIKSEDLPEAVVKALRKEFPKAEITGAEKGEEDGKLIYEVSIKDEKHNIDVTLDPHGKVTSLEKSLPPGERPKALVDSLNAKYPHATVKLVEEVWENGKLTGYEATIVTADKKSKEVDFDPRGKLVEDKK
jgi:uncharacterized membrane protein YkoI